MAVTYDAPIWMLDGWNLETGTWDEGSPIAMILADIRNAGVDLDGAAKRRQMRGVTELVSRGRDLLRSLDIMEDRLAVPVEVRPLIDLTVQLDQAEVDFRSRLLERYLAAALTDPRLIPSALKLRFPDWWSRQSQPTETDEENPHDVAWREALKDPNFALDAAALACRVDYRAAGVNTSRHRRPPT
jgi:hypothetical protein